MRITYKILSTLELKQIEILMVIKHTKLPNLANREKNVQLSKRLERKKHPWGES